MPHLADSFDIPGVNIEQPPPPEPDERIKDARDLAFARLDSVWLRLSNHRAPPLAFQRLLARKISEVAREIFYNKARQAEAHRIADYYTKGRFVRMIRHGLWNLKVHSIDCL